MSKNTKSAPQSFDLRTLDYFLANGEITIQDHEKYLKTLPDEEGNYVTIQNEEPDEDEDDDDDIDDEEEFDDEEDDEEEIEEEEDEDDDE